MKWIWNDNKKSFVLQFLDETNFIIWHALIFKQIESVHDCSVLPINDDHGKWDSRFQSKLSEFSHALWKIFEFTELKSDAHVPVTSTAKADKKNTIGSKDVDVVP